MSLFACLRTCLAWFGLPWAAQAAANLAEQSPSNRRAIASNRRAIADQSLSNRRAIADQSAKGKSKEADARPIAPEPHSTPEIRLQATREQRTGNAQAATEQPSSNDVANPIPLPRDSSKEESRQNNREDRTEKTEQRRQNREDRTTEKTESQYDCMLVRTVYCNVCMLVMIVRLNDCKTVRLNLES